MLVKVILNPEHMRLKSPVISLAEPHAALLAILFNIVLPKDVIRPGSALRESRKGTKGAKRQKKGRILFIFDIRLCKKAPSFKTGLQRYKKIYIFAPLFLG